MDSPSPRLVRVDVQAPQPYLRDTVVDSFNQLRERVRDGAGFDFLARVGDMFRARDFTSNKPGVATRSRHKCGDAVDINQEDPHIVVCRDDQRGRVYWHVFLRCEKQDGTQGSRLQLTPWNFSARGMGQPVTAYFFNFTAAAEDFGWERISAWSQWAISHRYTLAEWWHFQKPEGLTYDEAISYLYSSRPTDKPLVKFDGQMVLGLNDRGAYVRELQARLKRAGFMQDEPDGIYGFITYSAVRAFQRSRHLPDDGLYGPKTHSALLNEMKMISDK